MFGDAEAYEQFMGRWSRLVAPGLVEFTGVPERGRILDAGSGTGSLSFAIAERNVRGRVLGIDPSREYVAYDTSRNPYPDRASFEVGDGQQLHFPDASFDAALSLLVFNFTPDPRKALLELRRVTRPGGKISAAVWDYGAGMRMLRTFWDAAVHIDPGAEKLDEKHMPLCRAGELSTLWRQGGLENVHEQAIDIRMSFLDHESYKPCVTRLNSASHYRRTPRLSFFPGGCGRCAALCRIIADAAGAIGAEGQSRHGRIPIWRLVISRWSTGR